MAVLISAIAVPASAGECSGAEDEVYDLLYEYKDAYNLRDLEAIESLYMPGASIRSFAFPSSDSMSLKDFSQRLPRVASQWLDEGFKLNLFKITSFDVNEDRATARVRWKYRTQQEKGIFRPSFIMLKTAAGWKILKEDYGRKED